MKQYGFTDSLWRFLAMVDHGGAAKIVVSPSVLRHASAVIAVYIVFQKITKYILYRFKVTGSLHLNH